jgi:hypothetical protein
MCGRCKTITSDQASSTRVADQGSAWDPGKRSTQQHNTSSNHDLRDLSLHSAALPSCVRTSPIGPDMLHAQGAAGWGGNEVPLFAASPECQAERAEVVLSYVFPLEVYLPSPYQGRRQFAEEVGCSVHMKCMLCGLLKIYRGDWMAAPSTLLASTLFTQANWIYGGGAGRGLGRTCTPLRMKRGKLSGCGMIWFRSSRIWLPHEGRTKWAAIYDTSPSVLSLTYSLPRSLLCLTLPRQLAITQMSSGTRLNTPLNRNSVTGTRTQADRAELNKG